uniref:Uncharacterized protein MANES_12G050300 n=1 Tax=Rhizophora mucronata TaxID=61149 RepID=A0A2P2JD59_RHIMU
MREMAPSLSLAKSLSSSAAAA